MFKRIFRNVFIYDFFYFNLKNERIRINYLIDAILKLKLNN